MDESIHQITLQEYMKDNFPVMVANSCGKCICDNCLYWWSSRCPHGKCFDDYRAKINPYDLAHPDEPPRTGWTNWKTDQAFWCRGAAFYPTYSCDHYIKYTGQQVKSCLYANVSIFQDGYIACSLVESVGCQECYERFERRNEIE